MLSETVRQLGELHFEGNVVPHNWFKHPALKLPNGRVNLNAVIILAEICYWYRPRLIQDEATGHVLDRVNRFKGDRLQRTYQALGEKFGLTKRQAQEACYFLEGKGVLRIERRAVEVEGVMAGNVTFFEPIVEKVRELNGADTLSRSSVRGIPPKRERVARSGGRGITSKRESSLENRRETKEIEPPTQEELETFRQAGGKFRDEV